MDWKLVLMKYINHVGNCEGTSFIRNKPDSFSSEEWQALGEALEESYSLDTEND